MKFIKPSIDEIKLYLDEKKITSFQADVFWNYYESKGWLIGKSPMKNWRAAVATWNKNNFNNENKPLDNEWLKIRPKWCCAGNCLHNRPKTKQECIKLECENAIRSEIF